MGYEVTQTPLAAGSVIHVTVSRRQREVYLSIDANGIARILTADEHEAAVRHGRIEDSTDLKDYLVAKTENTAPPRASQRPASLRLIPIRPLPSERRLITDVLAEETR